MDLAALAGWLQDSALGAWMRGGGWSYAAVNVAHLLGLVLLVGTILLLDLRLLGFGRSFDARAVAKALLPFAVSGLLLMLCSGVALLSADARALAVHPLLQVKLAAVLVGLGNVAWFHLAFARHLDDWDRTRPPLARLCVFASIALWLCILALGRLIAYV
jgi:hypothetical protein